jgi:soluble lytic murein transglycosylase-like protein
MIEVPGHILTELTWASGEHGVAMATVLAVAMAESGMDPNALGDYTAEGIPESFGLMQLHVRGAGYGYTREQLLDLHTNVDIGVRYLRACLDAFPGDLYTGLSAYNQGIGGAKERGWTFNRTAVERYIYWYERFLDEGYEGGPAPPPQPGCWTLGGTVGILSVATWLLAKGVM